MDKTRVIGYEIKAVDRLIGKRVRPILERYGLDEKNPMKRWIAGYLYNHREETVYQKDLEVNLYIPRSTLAGLLKQMEKEGVIIRREAESDARLKQIVLSKEMIDKFRTSFQEVNREVDDYAVRDIDSNKLEVFYEVLEQIKQNLGGENRE